MSLFPFAITLVCVSPEHAASLVHETLRRPDPEAQQRLTELRQLVEPLMELPPAQLRKGRRQKIDLEVRVLSVSITYCGASFFADPRENRLAVGRLKAREPDFFVRALRRVCRSGIAPATTDCKQPASVPRFGWSCSYQYESLDMHPLAVLERPDQDHASSMRRRPGDAGNQRRIV